MGSGRVAASSSSLAASGAAGVGLAQTHAELKGRVEALVARLPQSKDTHHRRASATLVSGGVQEPSPPLPQAVARQCSESSSYSYSSCSPRPLPPPLPRRVEDVQGAFGRSNNRLGVLSGVWQQAAVHRRTR